MDILHDSLTTATPHKDRQLPGVLMAGKGKQRLLLFVAADLRMIKLSELIEKYYLTVLLTSNTHEDLTYVRN